MFTGIIEAVAIVKEVISNGSNKTFWVESHLANQLKPDQSVSHNGVCLTIEEIKGNLYKITAIEETLAKTNLEEWKTGSIVNIERSLTLSSRLDGHFVQGHVDATGVCLSKTEKQGSWEFGFEFAEKFAELVIEKGSICVNGISLTAFNVKKNSFIVAIIPYTFEHTNINTLNISDKVNLEFDILGKYLARKMSLQDK
jgi:riboflavin synthase